MAKKALRITIITFLTAITIIVIGFIYVKQTSIHSLQDIERIEQEEVFQFYIDTQYNELNMLVKSHAFWTTANEKLSAQDAIWLSDEIVDYLTTGDYDIDFVYIQNETKTFHITNLTIDDEIVCSNLCENVLGDNQLLNSMITIDNQIYIISGIPFADDDGSNASGALIIGRLFEENAIEDLTPIFSSFINGEILINTEQMDLSDMDLSYSIFQFDTIDETVYVAVPFDFPDANQILNLNFIISLIILAIAFSIIILTILYIFKLFNGTMEKTITEIQDINIHNRRFSKIELTEAPKFNKIINVLNDLIQSVDTNIHHLDDQSMELVNLLKNAMEMSDSYTYQHGDKVAELSCLIGEVCHIENINDLNTAATLHDIGKVFVHHEILNKPASLTKIEYEHVKQHPRKGSDLLKNISGLKDISESVLCHHERWDGSGYPNQLKGTDIPLFARIIAIADVYDALTSKRPYRASYSSEYAVDYITEKSGTHFDPQLVECFLIVISKYIKKI